MTKYYISSRHYRGPNSFKQFEGWTEWMDFSTTRYCYPNWVFDNKKDAEKKLKELKREDYNYERMYDDVSSHDYKIMEHYISD